MENILRFFRSNRSYFYLIAGMLAGILHSPRWSISIFAWLSPFFFLLFVRSYEGRFRWLLLGLAIYLSSLIAGWQVFPMPLLVTGIILLWATLKWLIIYSVDNWFARQTNQFFATFIFPCLVVANEYLDAQGGGGVWGAMANSQFDFPWLMQLASITGIWGISFWVSWTAAVFVWVFRHNKTKSNDNRGLLIYSVVSLLVFTYGAFRQETRSNSVQHSVVVGGCTVPTLSLLEAVYEDVNRKKIHLPLTISQSSPQLQQVNQALVQFIEKPDSSRYPLSFQQMDRLHDSLFSLTKKLAREGAKIISWSEGNGFMLKYQEERMKGRGGQVAKQCQVYLLMAVAVIRPGKISAGDKFIENKTWLFNPDGQLVNEFHKNRPVPMVENSVPGDQQIPIIHSPWGTLSPSICYDGDFPALIRQISQQKTDLLLLPSGDWKAIAPYHSYMARYRAIENGVPIVRQANGGLSIACDSRGRIIASQDFYLPGEKAWTTRIETGHEKTIYSVVGDILAYLCSLVAIVILLMVVLTWILRRKGKRKVKATVRDESVS